MSEQVNLEHIEEQARRAFAQDGLMFLYWHSEVDSIFAAIPDIL